jgi:pimeloyl-ACP methyl ester carboxylesterase
MSAIGLKFRPVLTILILFGLCLGLGGEVVLAAPVIPKIAWSPCYREYGPFECGTVQVPLDYSRPNGAAISIALIRLPAGDSVNKIGSLFLNPGGPGGSGVDFALFVAPYIYTPEVRARFDIVGFDPRGISRSTALRCFGNAKQWGGYFTEFSFPISLEEASTWEAADRFLDSACDQRGSKIIDHMSTANVARDLDLLRQAVGDEMLTYAGYSYGTFLGVTYANLFPDKVRALVVDGVLDPVAWTTGTPGEENLPFSTRLRSDVGAMDSLKEFFRLCDTYPENCPFAPDAEARFAALAANLRTAPLLITLPDGTTFKFIYQDLIGNALGAMYNSFSWPSFAEFLAAIESIATPSSLGQKLNAFWNEVGLITKRGFPNYYNAIEGFPAVACGDSDNPSNYTAWWDAAVQAEADYGYFGPLWTYASSICAEWPGGKEGRYTGPFNTWTVNSVLVVGSKYDPATRYQGALTVHDLLPNSQLLTVEGWAHCAFFLSYEADAAVGEYLVNLTLPPDGNLFFQDWVPFSTPMNAAFAAEANARSSVAHIMIPELVRKNVK